MTVSALGVSLKPSPSKLSIAKAGLQQRLARQACARPNVLGADQPPPYVQSRIERMNAALAAEDHRPSVS